MWFTVWLVVNLMHGVVNVVHRVQRAQVVHDVHVVQEVALRHPLKALPEAFP